MQSGSQANAGFQTTGKHAFDILFVGVVADDITGEQAADELGFNDKDIGSLIIEQSVRTPDISQRFIDSDGDGGCSAEAVHGLQRIGWQGLLNVLDIERLTARKGFHCLFIGPDGISIQAQVDRWANGSADCGNTMNVCLFAAANLEFNATKTAGYSLLGALDSFLNRV